MAAKSLKFFEVGPGPGSARAIAVLLNNFGAGKWTRTTDLRITNALLYHLSYSGIDRNLAGAVHRASRHGAKYRGSYEDGQSAPAARLRHAARPRFIRSALVTDANDDFHIVRLGTGRQVRDLVELKFVQTDVGQFTGIDIIKMMMRVNGRIEKLAC